eukprot:COSAG01_NODE_13765_length_1538_cov_2.259903_1_plen_459_part_01
MTKRTRYPNETEEDYAEYEENYKAKRRAYRNALTRKQKTEKKQAAAEIAGTIQRGEEISPVAVRSYRRRAGRGSAPAEAPAEAARRLSDPGDWVQEPPSQELDDGVGGPYPSTTPHAQVWARQFHVANPEFAAAAHAAAQQQEEDAHRRHSDPVVATRQHSDPVDQLGDPVHITEREVMSALTPSSAAAERRAQRRAQEEEAAEAAIVAASKEPRPEDRCWVCKRLVRRLGAQRNGTRCAHGGGVWHSKCHLRVQRRGLLDTLAQHPPADLDWRSGPQKENTCEVCSGLMTECHCGYCDAAAPIDGMEIGALLSYTSDLGVFCVGHYLGAIRAGSEYRGKAHSGNWGRASHGGRVDWGQASHGGRVDWGQASHGGRVDGLIAEEDGVLVRDGERRCVNAVYVPLSRVTMYAALTRDRERQQRVLFEFVLQGAVLASNTVLVLRDEVVQVIYVCKGSSLH